MTKPCWTYQAPPSPKQKPSDWYWCWDLNETEPIIVELWPNRGMGFQDCVWWTGPLEPRPPQPEKSKIKKDWKWEKRKEEE